MAKRVPSDRRLFWMHYTPGKCFICNVDAKDTLCDFHEEIERDQFTIESPLLTSVGTSATLTS